jgi:tyrosine-protein kinase Etk/Wzc
MGNNQPGAADNLPSSLDDSGLSLADLVENFLHYWWVFLAIFLSAIALSLAYAVVAPPIYTADVMIEVEPQKGTALGALKDVDDLLQGSRSGVQGELEILKSRAVLAQAINQSRASLEVKVLGRFPLIGDWLARRISPATGGLAEPPFLWGNFAWGGERLELDEFVVPEQLLGTQFVLLVTSPREWSLLDESGVEILRGQVGERRLGFRGSFSVRVLYLQGRVGTRFQITKLPLQVQLRRINKALSVRETSRQSNVIKATLEDRSPERAADLLNAIADAYVARNVGRRSEEARKSLDFLRKQLPVLKAEVERSERLLNEFRNKQRIIDISTEIRNLLERAVIVESRRAELALKRQEMSLRYEDAHPAIRSIDAQLFELEEESRRTSSDVGRLPSAEQQFLQLSRDVQVNTQLYVSLLNNAQQLEIARAGTVGNVAIVDRAMVPIGPARPNKRLTVAVGGFAGFIFGLLLTQVLAALVGIVRDPRKLENVTGVPTLAIIPKSAEQLELGDQGASPFLLVKAQPLSATTEALRSLKTALLFAMSGSGPGKVLLVTSATPAQGKSFISANVAALLAEGGRKVLLVDADIRRRTLKRYLPVPDGALGLSDVLAGRATPAGCSIATTQKNLVLLPAGAPSANPGELFREAPLVELISWGMSEFDHLVVDSAPLLAVSDSTTLAKLADYVLFVARQGDTTLGEVGEALMMLRRLGVDRVGTVFNGYYASKLRYPYAMGYGYQYSYGYGRRYGGYRYGNDADA